jgi:exopolysaccharide biosynthesis polyprenyl glycosylphosphotransferase
VSGLFVPKPDDAVIPPPPSEVEAPPTRDVGLVAPQSTTRREYTFLYTAMAASDALAVVLSLLVATLVRWGGQRFPANLPVLIVLAPLLVVIIFRMCRLYEVHLISPGEEFRRVILAVSLTITGLVILSFWSDWTFSRSWIALVWGFSIVSALLSRRIWHWFIARARQGGRLSFRTLIVGANDEAEALSREMRLQGLGFTPVGYVTSDREASTARNLPILGSTRELRRLIAEAGVDCVFVASSAIRSEVVVDVARAARQAGVDVRVTANLPKVLTTRLAVQPLGSTMALSVRPVRLTKYQAAAKRSFDLVLASLGLIVTLPLWLVVAAAIRLNSPGPVLFRQLRVGHRGKPFRMLKFRTMVTDAESMLDSLRSRNEATGPLFKLRDDPRVTRVGKALRRWSVDELPQLLNVLRGDMSLVGPRPCLPEEVREFEEWQFDRFEVRPGITGLWQVSGRSMLTFDEYLRTDLFYIDNWSLPYDLYILLKTVPILFSGRGAY